jgi:hypothetical protein
MIQVRRDHGLASLMTISNINNNLNILVYCVLKLNLMLLLLQQVILKAPPTAVDSLKHSLAQMQHKVDSLEKIVVKTEIGGDFFSDALNTNLSLFVAIIGLSGLFGWAYFARVLNSHKNGITKRVDNALAAQKQALDIENEELRNQSLSTIFNVNRAMYFSIKDDENNINAFDWALSCAVTGYRYNPENYTMVKVFLVFAHEHLVKLSVGEPQLIENIERYNDIIKELITIENEEVKTELTKIRTDLYHTVYSKQQPPADLMESKEDSNAV